MYAKLISGGRIGEMEEETGRRMVGTVTPYRHVRTRLCTGKGIPGGERHGCSLTLEHMGVNPGWIGCDRLYG